MSDRGVGLPAPERAEAGPLAPVRVDDDLTLDFDDRGPVTPATTRDGGDARPGSSSSPGRAEAEIEPGVCGQLTGIYTALSGDNPRTLGRPALRHLADRFIGERPTGRRSFGGSVAGPSVVFGVRGARG